MSGIFFGLDRRQLDEPRQPGLTRHRDGHPIALHRVAREELLQRIPDQFDRFRAGLAENLRILDIVECLGDDLFGSSSARHAGLRAHTAQRQCPKRRHLPCYKPSSGAGVFSRKAVSIGQSRCRRQRCHRRQLRPPSGQPFSVPDSPRPEAGLSRCAIFRLSFPVHLLYRHSEANVNVWRCLSRGQGSARGLTVVPRMTRIAIWTMTAGVYPCTTNSS